MYSKLCNKELQNNIKTKKQRLRIPHLLTAHVKANHRFFLHLAVRGDGVSHHTPGWARQNGPWTTELPHGSQTAIWLHEQDVHTLRTEGNKISMIRWNIKTDNQLLEHLWKYVNFVSTHLQATLEPRGEAF